MTDDQPTVTVVIANWNGRSWLETCLPTLQKQTYSNFNIIIVDNGSTDGSITWLSENYPEVTTIVLDKNMGFAAANNIGIRAADSPLIALLNNDTLVSGGWLTALVTAVSSPNTGMAASCIVRWNEPELLDSAGIQVDRSGIAWNRGWEQPTEVATTACPVFGPSAAAALYRRDMLEEIGLFDEDYFAYYEDVDLAWRAQRAGWDCQYAPDALVRHWHSATSQKTPHFKNFLNGRNKLWTIWKNYDWPALLWLAPIIIAYDIMATLYQCVKSRNLAPINGRLQALKSFKKMKAKRQSPHRKAPLSPLPFPGKQPVLKNNE